MSSKGSIYTSQKTGWKPWWGFDQNVLVFFKGKEDASIVVKMSARFSGPFLAGIRTLYRSWPYLCMLARPSKCVPHLGWSSKPGYNHTVQPTKLRANQLRMMHWTSTQGHIYVHMHRVLTIVMLVAPLQWRVMHAHHLSILHWKPMIPSASIQQATKHIRKLLQYERVYTYVGIRFQT